MADLVDEQRPTRCLHKEAGPVSVGAGERAASRAHQRAQGERVEHGRRGGHELARTPGASMDLPGQHGLAGARGAGQQQVLRAGGVDGDLSHHQASGGRFSEIECSVHFHPRQWARPCRSARVRRGGVNVCSTKVGSDSQRTFNQFRDGIAAAFSGRALTVDFTRCYGAA